MVLSRCSATIAHQTPETVVRGIITGDDIYPAGSDVTFGSPTTVVNNGVPRLLFCASSYGDPDIVHRIYVVDLDAEGNPLLPATPLLETLGAKSQIVVSPQGDSMLMCLSDDPSQSELYLVTRVDEIIAGTASPITAGDDPRIHRVEDRTRNFVYSPGFSQDGTTIIYSKDMTDRYWAGLKESECDFDIMVNTVSDVLQGRTALRLPKWGNQMALKASGGGTRVVWTENYAADVTSSVYAATVRVIGTAPLSGGVLQADSVLSDGSGVQLSVAAGTVVGGVDPEATSIDVSVFTPISPIEEAALDASALPVVRDFGPSAISFDPPAQLRLTYADEEIRNLDENNLNVVWVHNGEPYVLPIIDVNPETNHVTVEVSGFSEFGVTDYFSLYLSDEDGDGLTDFQESMDLDPLTPGIQNPFDPDESDTTGDNGSTEADGIPDGQNDWDGDGMTNTEEFAWGFNPIDETSFGILPLSGITVLATLLLSALAGVKVLRRRRDC